MVRSPLFLELSDCLDDFVIAFDSTLRIQYANRGATAFFGYSENEFETKRLTLLLDAEEHRRMKSTIRTMKERRSDETVFVTRTHKKVRLRFSLSPVAEKEKNPTGYLLVGSPAQKERYSTYAHQWKDLAERVLDGLAEPVFIIDYPTRTVSECNEPAVSVSGFTREELVGRRLFDHVSSEEERRRFDALLVKADEAYAKTGIFRESTLLPRKTGLPLPCDCVSIPVFGPEGLPLYNITMFFDRSRAEEHQAVLADFAERVRKFASELSGFAEAFSERTKTKRLSSLGFTPRQIEIAGLVAMGASSKDIGFKLGISESTVKNHLSVMFRKLGAASRIDFLHTLIVQRIRIA